MKKLQYKKGERINNFIFVKEVSSNNAYRKGVFECRCGKNIEAYISEVKRNNKKHCGCVPHPNKKERISIYCACGCNMKLMSVNKYGRNKNFILGHNKGHTMPHTEVSIAKMSFAASGKKYSDETNLKKGCKKEKNPNWKGGVTKQNDLIRKTNVYKNWRKSVFERDNYTCQHCGEKEKVSGKLEADHIKPFAYFVELRFDINNGRTLCKECHKKTDTYLWKAQQKYSNLLIIP